MAERKRNGIRKTREQALKRRTPELGYYIIVTDTAETEQNYMQGLRDSIPETFRGRIVIKVVKSKTADLVDEAAGLAALYPQYGMIWIVFDRDEVKDFDRIIQQAEERGIRVGWTNPCIEEWFCAYFGSMPVYSGSVQCCEGFGHIFSRKTGQKYKKSDTLIYDKLNRFGNEAAAIKTAEEKLNGHKAGGKLRPSEQNPCTTLHLLVKELKDKTST